MDSLPHAAPAGCTSVPYPAERAQSERRACRHVPMTPTPTGVPEGVTSSGPTPGTHPTSPHTLPSPARPYTTSTSMCDVSVTRLARHRHTASLSGRMSHGQGGTAAKEAAGTAKHVRLHDREQDGAARRRQLGDKRPALRSSYLFLLLLTPQQRRCCRAGPTRGRPGCTHCTAVAVLKQL